MRSCERPRKRSASEALPSSVSKRYSFSTGTHGKACRRRASSSLLRVSSFSASSSSSRAASHSSRVPVLCVAIGLSLQAGDCCSDPLGNPRFRRIGCSGFPVPKLQLAPPPGVPGYFLEGTFRLRLPGVERLEIFGVFAQRSSNRVVHQGRNAAVCLGCFRFTRWKAARDENASHSGNPSAEGSGAGRSLPPLAGRPLVRGKAVEVRDRVQHQRPAPDRLAAP